VQIDQTVNILDAFNGGVAAALNPATVNALNTPVTFCYNRVITGRACPCGDFNVPNTASVVSNNNVVLASASANVAVKINCVVGCTRTIGYWQTHSKYGPAPYDSRWANLKPSGEDTLFFNSGQSYITVIKSSVNGNAFYNLGQQYVGTTLNRLAGVTVPADVLSAYNEATSLFSALGKGVRVFSSSQSTRALQLKDILDAYNNGLKGVPHCG